MSRHLATENTPPPELVATVWHPVLNGLRRTIKQNTRQLLRAHSEGSLSAVAWYVRNLVELSIWTEYCVKSPANALQFNLDAIRDFIDLMDLGEKFLSEVPENDQGKDLVGKYEALKSESYETLKTFEAILSRISSRSNLVIQDELNRRYTTVRTAAKEVGKLQFWDLSNKYLSKYAHPTAFSVMAASDVPKVGKTPLDNLREKNLDALRDAGLLYSKESIDRIKVFLKDFAGSQPEA